MNTKSLSNAKQIIARNFRLKLFLLTAVFVFIHNGIAVAQTETMRFAIIGDFGSGNSNEREVADLVKSWNPQFIVTTGDNNYPDGEAATMDANVGQFYHEFIAPYTGSYGAGASTNRFFPSLGNHDWDNTAGAPAQPYFDYFTLPGNERYYDFVQGSVHVFVIDSDSREPDGITATSIQATWLRNALAASTASWKIVVMHHPPYSSRTSWTKLQWAYQQWGASAVIAGHAHVYERIIHNGFPYITNGLGGESTGSFDIIHPESVVRFGSDYGAQLVTVNSTGITFQFITRAGVVIDSYTITGGVQPMPPNAPADLMATTVNESQINLSWTDGSVDESGFKIERCQGTGCTNFAEIAQTAVDVASFQDVGRAAGVTYQYRVRAFNNNGNSAYSNVAYATTVFLPPLAPGSLRGTAVSKSQINLSWTDNSSNESNFSIERCLGAGCSNFAEIVQVGANVSTYSNTGLPAETTYNYRVKAFNSAGSSSFSNSIQVTTLPEPPTAPSGLSATVVSSTRVNLTWTDNASTETGFRIERCKSSGCTNFAQIAQIGANVQGYADTNAKKNSVFRYRIFSFNAGGTSVSSNIVSVTTPR